MVDIWSSWFCLNIKIMTPIMNGGNEETASLSSGGVVSSSHIRYLSLAVAVFSSWFLIIVLGPSPDLLLSPFCGSFFPFLTCCNLLIWKPEQRFDTGHELNHSSVRSGLRPHVFVRTRSRGGFTPVILGRTKQVRYKKPDSIHNP